MLHESENNQQAISLENSENQSFNQHPYVNAKNRLYGNSHNSLPFEANTAGSQESLNNYNNNNNYYNNYWAKPQNAGSSNTYYENNYHTKKHKNIYASNPGGYYKGYPYKKHQSHYNSGYYNNNSNHNNSSNFNSSGNYYSSSSYGYTKKKKPFTYKLRWDGYDPYMVKSMIFRAEMYILNKYPNLANVNINSEGCSKMCSEKSKYFIIKSFNEEDVHKAIKYSLWSSTKAGNKTLNEAFLQTKSNDAFVYLFFSCNGSGRYVGVARMLSELDEKKEFNYWTQDEKWQGLFNIEWIFIKDIPFKCFKSISIKMK